MSTLHLHALSQSAPGTVELEPVVTQAEYQLPNFESKKCDDYYDFSAGVATDDVISPPFINLSSSNKPPAADFLLSGQITFESLLADLELVQDGISQYLELIDFVRDLFGRESDVATLATTLSSSFELFGRDDCLYIIFAKNGEQETFTHVVDAGSDPFISIHNRLGKNDGLYIMINFVHDAGYLEPKYVRVQLPLVHVSRRALKKGMIRQES